MNAVSFRWYGVYRILTQRDYSWGVEEWDDLWQDICEMLDDAENSTHYMGYLVLQTANNKRFSIIDGQQRLATFSILILAVLASLQDLIDQGIDSEPNSRRSEQLSNTYIGYLDPVSLVTNSKLELNRNNDKFYQQHLVPQGNIPKSGLNTSEKLLRQAFYWFKERLQERFKDKNTGAELASFIDFIADGLFFTEIIVSDDLNAYKVFETLNSRGVKLSSTDLLKNYLFSVISNDSDREEDLDALENRWGNIVGMLGNEKFPDFLRTYWNSKFSLLRHGELFKGIRKHITNRKEAFELILSLEVDAEVYQALRDPLANIWTDEQQQYVKMLNLFRVTQPHSLLLAAHRKLPPADFTRILRACAILSFRYNVIAHFNPNELEIIYNKICVGIVKGTITKYAEVLSALSVKYLPDEQFKNLFAEVEFKTSESHHNRLTRYILFAIEEHLTGAEYDADSDLYSIEHILPIHPADEWPSFTNNQRARFVFRLGNQTLLERQRNREIGNYGYTEKQATFAASKFKITQRIAAENAEWTPERITVRQKWLAKQACSIWRLDIQ